jgi:Fungal chitosanase of glycosyl hydrolase group 75
MLKSLVALLILISEPTLAQSVFTPPADSVSLLQGVQIIGNPIGDKFRSRFLECDSKNTCDGRTLTRGCTSDRNQNSTLLRLRGGVVFYDGKMGVDADGSPYAINHLGQTNDPNTSLRYPIKGSPSINADRVPYIVLPLGGFVDTLGVQTGDVGAVVYGGKRIYVVVADYGPPCKIGEGSIQAHEMLGHKVCRERSPNGDCAKLHDVSISRGVLYFIFPNTHKSLSEGLTPGNINNRIEVIGSSEWQKLLTH